jgi:hypothetical protein
MSILLAVCILSIKTTRWYRNTVERAIWRGKCFYFCRDSIRIIKKICLHIFCLQPPNTMSDTISIVETNGKRVFYKTIPFDSLRQEYSVIETKEPSALTERQEACVGLLNWLKFIAHDEITSIGCHSHNSESLCKGVELLHTAGIDSFTEIRAEVDQVDKKSKKSRVSSTLTDKKEARVGLLNWLKFIAHDERISIGCHSHNSESLCKGIELIRKADIDSFMGFSEYAGRG